MFQIPTGEQWQALFSVSEQLRKTKCWETFPEELIFAFTRNGEVQFYLTVHGYEEEAKGISIYRNLREIQHYMTILQGGDDVSLQTIIGNQSCISVIFTNREQLGNGDVTAMEQGGFTPEESETGYIIFRDYKPGKTPWYIGAEEADLLTDGLVTFAGLTATAEIPLPDATKEMLQINLLQEKAEIEAVPLNPNFFYREEDIVKDDFYLARLKKLKRNGRTLEIDLCYLANPVSSELGAVPFFPKMCLIADRDEGYIADQCIFEETTVETEAFFELLAKYFSANGLPWKIYIREENTAFMLNDLCKKLNIELIYNKELLLIDDFIGMIGGMPTE